MNLLPKATSEFSQTEFWDKFFKKRGKKAFEWYGEYPELCGILHKYIRPKDKTLVIGCGNSTLSSDLYDVGYKSIVNVDTSSVVIKQMKARHKGKAGLEYHKMDATNMSFADESFTAVLDKGTLDALMPDSSPEILDRITKLFDEVDRVLAPFGRYVCISLLQQHILHQLLCHFSSLGWMIRICRCEEAEKSSNETGNSGFTMPVFVVICTKLKKSTNNEPVFEVSQSGDIIVRMATMEDTVVAVKTMQDAALVCSGLNRYSLADTGEVTMELERPGDKHPRYTVTVADSPKVKDTANMKFAAFIVPQGREQEWLFGTPEGRQVLVESSGFDRLAVIRLHREHKYESLKATQDEMGETIMKLAPETKGSSRPIIPFLSVASDLGNVTEIARGESEISGGFIIEDAEGADEQLFRRLVFMSNQNLVQSEVKLKKVEVNGKTDFVIDEAHLACEHHIYMTLGVSLVAQDTNSHVLVLGLGGGSLCTYIHKCFPMIRITAIDIDPVVVEVATKYFGFKQDDKMKVIVEDGVDYLRSAASAGKKFDAILFDLDCKDSSLGLKCPPECFLQTDILKATADCITDNGVFMLNFVCRDKEIRKETIPKLEKLYKCISSVKLEQEVNEIIYCWKNKPSSSLEDAANKFNAIVKSRNIQEDDLIDEKYLHSLLICIK